MPAWRRCGGTSRNARPPPARSTGRSGTALWSTTCAGARSRPALPPRCRRSRTEPISSACTGSSATAWPRAQPFAGRATALTGNARRGAAAAHLRARRQSDSGWRTGASFAASSGCCTPTGGWTSARGMQRATCSAGCDAPLICATVSRLLVDLNRSIGHPALVFRVHPRAAAEPSRQEILVPSLRSLPVAGGRAGSRHACAAVSA